MSKVIQCVYLCSVPWDALSQGPSFDVVVGMLSTALAGWRAVSFGTWAVPAPGQFRHPERPKVDAFWGKISGGNRRFQYAQTSGFEYFFKQGQNKWGPCFGGVGYRYRHLEPLPERYPSKKDLRKRHKPIRPPAVLFCQMDVINYLQLSGNEFNQYSTNKFCSISSRELTYPTSGKGKSSSNMPGEKDMLVPRRVFSCMLYPTKSWILVRYYPYLEKYFWNSELPWLPCLSSTCVCPASGTTSWASLASSLGRPGPWVRLGLKSRQWRFSSATNTEYWEKHKKTKYLRSWQFTSSMWRPLWFAHLLDAVWWAWLMSQRDSTVT